MSFRGYQKSENKRVRLLAKRLIRSQRYSGEEWYENKVKELKALHRNHKLRKILN